MEDNSQGGLGQHENSRGEMLRHGKSASPSLEGCTGPGSLTPERCFLQGSRTRPATRPRFFLASGALRPTQQDTGHAVHEPQALSSSYPTSPHFSISVPFFCSAFFLNTFPHFFPPPYVTLEAEVGMRTQKRKKYKQSRVFQGKKTTRIIFNRNGNNYGPNRKL